LPHFVLKRERKEFEKILPFIYQMQANGINQLRAENSLPNFESYLGGFTFGDVVCFADAPELVGIDKCPDNHNFLGPVSWSPEIQLPEFWDRIDRRFPIVYLSLGSSGPRHLLPLIEDALRDPAINLVVSTAGDTSFKAKRPNTFVASYLPGAKVLQEASLAITNGGSPGSYQALQFGVPVLGIPSNMDQLLCMGNLPATGACCSVREDLATLRNLSKILHQMLDDQSFSKNARLIKAKLARFDFKESFSSVLRDFFNSEKFLASNF
jgi:UDP:flavonoid glycosyltransferase YjiC (YdhE family)